MSDALIRVRGAARAFGAVCAVDGVDLDVHRGTMLALLGPSGCGKTTMLRLLAGFEPLDAGTVEIDEVLVAGAGAWVPPERRRVGMVFQDYALFPHLTVAGNVAYGLAQRWLGRGLGRGDHTARRQVADVLDLVGLAGLEDRYPAALSGGQQQRVALARALAPRPAVILLDEPFSNLDAALRAQVRDDVRRILTAADATAVFVTHDQEEALSLADEVAVMRAGRVAQLARPEDLYRKPSDRDVAGFVGDAEFLPGHGTGGQVDTELGLLPLALPVRGAVDVMVRPEDILLTPAAEGDATVLGRTFYGHDQMLSVRLATGRVVRSRIGPVSLLEAGDRCTVGVTRAVLAYPKPPA